MSQTGAASRPRTTVIRFRDAEEGFDGFLAFDGHDHPLAAGGFRVQPGLTAATVSSLAQAMTLKQRVLGLGVDGAKCGIDYDPRAPGKRQAMRRFLRFLRPYLLERFSMGPDMGTAWDEIEALAREQRIPSVKIAVAQAQGLSGEEFRQRLRLLDVPVHGVTLGRRRAGHALAHATIGALGSPGGASRPVRVGLQGFGTVGRATALSLTQAGLRVTAVADEYGCLVDEDGLGLGSLLATPQGTSVGDSAQATVAPPDALFEQPVDVLVLAACQDGLPVEAAEALSPSIRLVVVGANLGVAQAVEGLLHARGVAVVPDFVGGAGGSASMNVLFGSPHRPSVGEFLDRLGAAMQGLARKVLELADDQGVTPRQAALQLCDRPRPTASGRPYHWSATAGCPPWGTRDDEVGG